MEKKSNAFRARVKRMMWWRDQRGSSTVEFVIWFPFFMTLFLTSFELSFYGLRSAFLERAVDVTVRDLRLGAAGVQDTAAFKTRVCENMLIKGTCEQDVAVELTIIDPSSWTFPSGAVKCIDRNDPLWEDPVYGQGGGGDLMLLRVCWQKRPFFPTTPLVMGLPRDPDGEIALIAMSTYVNEP